MRYGSLFSGAGGLDLAIEEVFDAECAWQCEYDSAASKVLATHWPDVPNLHDVTKVDWSTVEPVDIMCGGYPCQPFSAAGQRKGTDDERHLWPYFAEAIRRVRPRYVVLENVAGHRSMGFDSVLGDLASLGYDAQWCSIRASDVGAPHRRERLFVLATDSDCSAGWECIGPGQTSSESGRGEGETRQGIWSDVGSGGSHAANTTRDRRHEGRPESAGLVRGPDVAVGSDADVALLPTPRAADPKMSMTAPAAMRHVAAGFGTLPEVVGAHLLPTPCAARSGRNQSPSPGAAVRPSLDSITDLLPTPRRSDGDGGPNPLSRAERMDDVETRVIRCSGQWGKYAPAIYRWETVTRPAPLPIEPNTQGNPRLAAAFSEWMMGWTAGWVTVVKGLSRNDQLRIIGNGVVTLQAVAALRWLLTVSEVAA